MVDDLTPQNAAPTGDPMPGLDEKPGFFKTSAGRIVLIVGAVLGFLTVAGIAVAVVMTFFLGNVVDEALTTGITTTTSKPASETAEAVAVEPDEVPLSDIFTFRDIFDPLVKPAPASEETSGSSESSATADGESGTLYLQNIIVEDGVSKAVLEYNGTLYSLPQGGVIPGTPWQVLSIGSSSVVVLYGDSQISLSIGQGVLDSSQDVSNK